MTRAILREGETAVRGAGVNPDTWGGRWDHRGYYDILEADYDDEEGPVVETFYVSNQNTPRELFAELNLPIDAPLWRVSTDHSRWPKHSSIQVERYGVQVDAAPEDERCRVYWDPGSDPPAARFAFQILLERVQVLGDGHIGEVNWVGPPTIAIRGVDPNRAVGNLEQVLGALRTLARLRVVRRGQLRSEKLTHLSDLALVYYDREGRWPTRPALAEVMDEDDETVKQRMRRANPRITMAEVKREAQRCLAARSGAAPDSLR